MSSWHRQTVEATVTALRSNPATGLTDDEARDRLIAHGANRLMDQQVRGPLSILREQFTATMVLILIAAAVLSAALGDFKDATVILIVVLLNGALGFAQEYRAERAVEALRRMAVPAVRVRRGGYVMSVPAETLVPGDIVELEEGASIPADGRLILTSNLRIQEAALTGESEAVEKHTAALTGEDVPVADRSNMAFMGTLVAYGRGTLLVTDTGMRTELGQVASLIQSVGNEPTPLQKKLDRLGRDLAKAALGIVTVIFLLGIYRGEPLRLMFLTAVSMAVAAVPEGLPAVVTIALALGSQRMLRRKALIRKLAAVETLGSVTVVCSDKTGTLTENRMTVAHVEVPGKTVRLGIAAREPLDPDLKLLLIGGALCNDAVLNPGAGSSGGFNIVGDPTEAALVAAAAAADLHKPHLEARLPRVAEQPFDSDRKLMTTIHAASPWPLDLTGIPALDGTADSPEIAFTKGAVDQLAPRCSAIWIDGTAQPMTEGWRQWIRETTDRYASEGVRMLAVAFRRGDGLHDDHDVEHELTFVGMTGLIDPPRREAREAVDRCHSAQIRTVMITGDHPLTARAIAAQVGIESDGTVFTGSDLLRLSAEELRNTVGRVSIYARVSPEHKLRIVQALQDVGHVVAMTGDGVNDAPALKKATIGVAMGQSGTDVAREAADMVLLDDNFATIVAAIEEGRVIYDNVRKFIRYLMTTNSAELWVMLLAPLLGMPLPLLPLQILWINLVTDGPTSLMLSVEPAERNIMSRPPHPPNEGVFARGLGTHVVWVGILMAAVSLAVGYGAWRLGMPEWQTLLFTVVALSQMGHVMAIRSERDSLFTIGLRSNTPLLLTVAGVILLQFLVVYSPLLGDLLETTPLTVPQMTLAVLAGALTFAAVEVEKWWGRRNRPAAAS